MVVDNVRGDLLGCVASMYKGSAVEQCGFLLPGPPWYWYSVPLGLWSEIIIIINKLLRRTELTGPFLPPSLPLSKEPQTTLPRPASERAPSCRKPTTYVISQIGKARKKRGNLLIINEALVPTFSLPLPCLSASDTDIII